MRGALREFERRPEQERLEARPRKNGNKNGNVARDDPD
jgi:hypothetical protein